jgi:hypothetical protein
VAKDAAYVVVHFHLSDSATTEQRAAAQSDKVQFNYYLTLEPEEAP